MIVYCSIISCLLVLLAPQNTLGLSEEMQELLDQLHNTCVAETGVSEDLIPAFRKGDFQNDEKIKCYILCIMQQLAAVGDDGVVDVEALVAMMPPDIAGKIEPTVRKCGAIIGANPCETTWLTHQCYQQNGGDAYFLP